MSCYPSLFLAKDGLFRRLSRMSLRLRLIIAFVFLILSSAFATIIIGKTVFNQKVDELAISKSEENIKASEQIVLRRIERMRLLGQCTASHIEGLFLEPEQIDFLVNETPLDFIIVSDGPTALVTQIINPEPEDYRYAEEALETPGLSNHKGIQWTRRELKSGIPKPLWELVESARSLNRAVAAMTDLNGGEIHDLIYETEDERVLAIACAAPIAADRFVIFGFKVNGRQDLVGAMLKLAGEQQGYGASIFLYDQRISTILGDEVLGSKVDPIVAKQVLENGKIYIGKANVVDDTFFTAYIPIRNCKNKVIGIIGVGTSENAYSDVRNRTTLLFSSLICAGMFFGFLMTYWFSSWLLRPVSKLAEGMEKLAHGDLDHKVEIQSADELGQLANSFNIMMRAVKSRDLKLQEMTKVQLTKVEKQVSIGRLAAGVAHEINNPLTTILAFSSLMYKHMEDDDKNKEEMEIIVEETRRCRDIVSGLLDFARERPPEKKTVDINHVVRDTIVLTGNYEAIGQVHIDVDFSENALLVNADPKQLIQVFANIIMNSVQACESGGEIIISTREDFPGGFVNVEITDNGKGISKENMRNIFEPFFTTKEPGKGTGLGLSVSQGIVRANNGSLIVESVEGKGTSVKVVLPIVEPYVGWWGGGYG